MGKRKERRLAAVTNAGRRVKLDLCTEPSGELVAPEKRDEVGGDLKDSAESPNSPSSLAQKHLGLLLGKFCIVQQNHNPLMLLGQYTDDEAEEESDESFRRGMQGDSSANTTKCQVEEQAEEGCKDVDIQAGSNFVVPHVELADADQDTVPPELILKEEDDKGGDIDPTALDKSTGQAENTAQFTVGASSEVKVIGDVGSGWKMVLHKESNQYYYWNIETGETSWEVPEALSQISGLVSDHKTVVGCSHDDHIGSCEFPLVSAEQATVVGAEHDMPVASTLISRITAYQSGSPLTEWVEGSRNELLENKGGSACLSASGNANQCDLDALNGPMNREGHTSGDVLASTESESRNDYYSCIMIQAESLLEKLRSLKGSQRELQSLEWISRYTVEIEVRLSDIRALLLCGSVLLPFWEHSKMRLKHLEGVINDGIYQLAQSAVLEEVPVAKCSSFSETEKVLENQNGSDVGRISNGENSSHSGEKSCIISHETPDKIDISPRALLGYGIDGSEEYGTVTADRNGGSSIGQLGSSVAGNEAHGNVSVDVVCEPGFQASEDVDMDVDMEVEDITAEVKAANLDLVGCNSNYTIQQEPSTSSVDIPGAPTPPNEEWIPPPPPGDEYIPPPPPDDEEPVPPPPPPDEYQELSYFQLQSYTAQSLPFTEQYNLTYSDPNYQFYGSLAAAAVPNGPLYGQEVQTTLSHVPFYYGMVTSSETAPVLVNSVDPTRYDFESSMKCESALESSNRNLDASARNGDNKVACAEVSSTCAAIEASLTAPLRDSACQSVQSMDRLPVKTGGVSTSKKAQSKVGRTKKRALPAAPSLRSNKKVSSLVDKWKAAKEELNESEDDEPETAYEFLEKKRQKEIEEWYAKQIASGEAKDNANFQPLGGDWRERVKRKRAKAARESAKVEEQKANDNEQPDLVEASKNLPPGWQAYWDESSKQIYYGNRYTSESAWTKPKK